MNVLLVTFGSRGDVQPFVALGKGLQDRGHRVTVCTCSRFESFITDFGLDYGYASNDLLDLMDSDAGRDAMENSTGVFSAIATTIKLMKDAKSINRQLLEDSWTAAQAANPDLIIFHPKVLAGLSIAEKLDIPAVMALPCPMLVPTAERPTIGFPNLPLGPGYNRFTYNLVQMGYRSYGGMVDEFRRDILGLKKWPQSSGVLRSADNRPIPILHFYSTAVVPRPQDWPDCVRVTGYWFLDSPEPWEPSAALKAFLDRPDPTVYIGFGSMAGRDPARVAEIAIAALQKAKLRGIIATGWGGLDPGELPDTIFQIDSAPHAALFPQVSSVVHHGGAGTTAAGLRAGCPTIVCPFFGDQPFWGECVRELGVGTKPIPQKQLTVERLASALTEVTTNPTIRQRANALSDRIRREDGIGNTIAIIENM